FAVLERAPGAHCVELARSGSFDLVAWVAAPERQYDTAAFHGIARHGIPLVALLAEASVEALTSCLQSGADACLQLDADTRVVAAQVHAVLRRRQAALAAEEPDLGLIEV